MSLSLEYGKRYRSRQGRITAPLVKSPDDYKIANSREQWPFYDPESGFTFAPDGLHCKYPGSPADLISEHIEPKLVPDMKSETVNVRAFTILEQRVQKLEAAISELFGKKTVLKRKRKKVRRG